MTDDPTTPTAGDEGERVRANEEVLPPTPSVVRAVMEKAQAADGRALFAGLQAAVSAIVELSFAARSGEEVDMRVALRRIDAALTIGAPYGSPEHLAAIKR